MNWQVELTNGVNLVMGNLPIIIKDDHIVFYDTSITYVFQGQIQPPQGIKIPLNMVKSLEDLDKPLINLSLIVDFRDTPNAPMSMQDLFKEETK